MFYISKLDDMVNLNRMVIMIVMVIKVIIVMIIIRDKMVITVEMVIMVKMVKMVEIKLMVEDRQDRQEGQGTTAWARGRQRRLGRRGVELRERGAGHAERIRGEVPYMRRRRTLCERVPHET